MSGFPSFASFYRAANGGLSPLPWQERLANCVGEGGRWPSEIAIPTGLGKTSCLDIAVYALARQAKRPPSERRAPTRIWYVVNRRLLVEAATSRAERLAGLLADPSGSGGGDEAIAAVAAALSSLAALGSAAGPLHVCELRGGAELGMRSPDPSQATLVLSTVAMFASRLLFRGFGSSTSMRPIDAAQAGTDALVLLDEAHLSRPLLTLIERYATCDPGDPTTLLSGARSRPTLVAMTATGEQGEDRFELDEADLAHPIVRKRLGARKATTLVELERKQLSAALCDAALEASDEARSVVVFMNTARRAREVERLLRRSVTRDKRDLDILLATGRMREREAATVRAKLLDAETGVRAGRRLGARERPLVVVATQTLEVGADLDFDVLVSETASVRALTQRLGRLDRLGERPDARALLCHPRDGEDPVYGNEPATVAARLHELGEGPYVLGPSTVREALGEPGDVPARSAELLAEHLFEYAKTTRPEPGEPPPELFYAGFDDRFATISCCWRAHLPGDGVRLVPSLRASEVVEVPLGEARSAFTDRGLVTLRRLGRDAASLETIATERLAPGDVVVLPASAGCYDEHGWNPEADDLVLDVALLETGTLPLSIGALSCLLEDPRAGELESLEGLVRAVETFDETDDTALDPIEVARKLLAELATLRPHGAIGDDEWRYFLGSLSPEPLRPLGDVCYLAAPRRRRGQASGAVRADAFEELSFDAGSVTLIEHVKSVGAAAKAIGERLGLEEALVAALALAGRCHDLGKSDPRFQRWLDPAGGGELLLAKSRARREAIEASRIASGWPRGGRHEAISARMLVAYFATARRDEIDADLVIHLVGSHHGGGRPLIYPVEDELSLLVSAEVEGATVKVPGDLSLVDWSQPRRFHDLSARYGLWGLCLLEAIVRQADHAASSAVGVA